ncbi:MAG: hypothetical protein ACF8Q5_09350 [Phycisphaerales bacterium JB040]
MSVMTLESCAERGAGPGFGVVGPEGEPAEGERAWGSGERDWSESVGVAEAGGDEDLDDDESYFLEEDEDDDDEDGYDAGFLDDEDEDLDEDDFDTDEDDDDL